MGRAALIAGDGRRFARVVIGADAPALSPVAQLPGCSIPAGSGLRDPAYVPARSVPLLVLLDADAGGSSLATAGSFPVRRRRVGIGWAGNQRQARNSVEETAFCSMLRTR